MQEGFVGTREALHQLAYFALAPARYEAEGRMGLRPSPGGFATPSFDGKVARVDGDLLVLESAAGVASRTITTVADACAFLGISYEVDWFVGFKDVLDPWPPDKPLALRIEAVNQIGDWFLFGGSVLDRLCASVEDEVTDVQLWPEHFDVATEIGAELSRASYGASPGDGAHPEPYVYVAAWGEIDRGNEYWNDSHFNGASLGYSVVMGSDDPPTTALEFLSEGYRLLNPV